HYPLPGWKSVGRSQAHRANRCREGADRYAGGRRRRRSRGASKVKPLLSSLKIAATARRTNKMRAALTMLGVIIGVSAVIATVAVGTGATQTVQAQIS